MACFYSATLAWIPTAVDTGHYMSASLVIFHGEGNDDERFVLAEPHQGGWGGFRGHDGASILCPTVDGDTQNYSIELLEARQPIICTQYSFNTSDGIGHGQWRGGLGAIREYQMCKDGIQAYGSLARSVEPPWGMNGGLEGSENYFLVNGRNVGARIRDLTLKEGDRVTIVTGSGGGFGPPRRRSRQDIAADHRDQFISSKDVRDIYGIENPAELETELGDRN